MPFALSMLLACGTPTPVPEKEPPAAFQRVDEPPADRPPAPAGPNVVLLLGCTVRRDQVGVYGAPVETMPWLRSFAERGVRFVDPIVAAPWTRASSAAIVTGLHPLELGMIERQDRRNDLVLPETAETLAERFRRAGYRTVGGTTNPNLNRVFGFAQGFDTYVEPARLWRKVGHRMPGDLLGEQLGAAVGPAGGRPLFLQAMFVDAHAPYDRERVPELEVPGEPPVISRYRAGLVELDDVLEGFVERLESLGYTRENTVFVVASDHGEGLSWPAHHGVGHGNYLYGSSVEGVWVMAGAGIPRGRTVEGVVSTVDIGTTLGTLAGLSPLPPGIDQSPSWSDGRSRRPSAVADTWFRGVSRAAIYSEEWACMKEFAPPARPAPTGRFVAGCYDRSGDPLHQRPSRRPELQEELDAWRAARPVGEGARTEVSEDLREQLEQLGYTE